MPCVFNISDHRNLTLFVLHQKPRAIVLNKVEIGFDERGIKSIRNKIKIFTPRKSIICYSSILINNLTFVPGMYKFKW